MNLTATEVKALKRAASRYARPDGGGLFIDVLPSGTKSWIFRYRLKGAPQEKVVLGRFPDLSLAEARDKRVDIAKMVKDGKSPAQEQKLKRAPAVPPPAGLTLRTFANSISRNR
jgi:hypothetical protein